MAGLLSSQRNIYDNTSRLYRWVGLLEAEARKNGVSDERLTELRKIAEEDPTGQRLDSDGRAVRA